MISRALLAGASLSVLLLGCATHRGVTVTVERVSTGNVSVEARPELLKGKQLEQARSLTRGICEAHELGRVPGGEVPGAYRAEERLDAVYSRPRSGGRRPGSGQGISVSVRHPEDGALLRVVINDWEGAGGSEELDQIAEEFRRSLAELFPEPAYRVSVESHDLGFWTP